FDVFLSHVFPRRRRVAPVAPILTTPARPDAARKKRNAKSLAKLRVSGLRNRLESSPRSFGGNYERFSLSLTRNRSG
ncbi:MAG: hypothetical protein IJY15_10275, partial [Thermoguttaceae bacterium]|nr:hypothetical protein [Thermoguttaceae bacterium]